jgi:hypothetical protein
MEHGVSLVVVVSSPLSGEIFYIFFCVTVVVFLRVGSFWSPASCVTLFTVCVTICLLAILFLCIVDDK